MADGAVLAYAGASCLTTIAKEFNIPVFAVQPKIRFTPKYYFA
jgi:translation initiation factor 2B subunit (eIF-2B alpha/beta/delta family)